jgi:hypothetical protein
MQPSTKVKQLPPAGLKYPFAGPPAPGELREVASGVHWLRMPLPFVLEHINLWLLADGDGWTIVDCGFGDEVLEACVEPKTGAQIMPIIFKRPLDARQTLFAMGETLSHINYLHQRGRLDGARGDDGVYRYTRSS